jgi:hypothetical protein
MSCSGFRREQGKGLPTVLLLVFWKSFKHTSLLLFNTPSAFLCSVGSRYQVMQLSEGGEMMRNSETLFILCHWLSIALG